MSEPWQGLPAILAEEVAASWQESCPEGLPEWLASAGVTAEDLARALASSQFLRQILTRDSELLADALRQRPLTEPTTRASLEACWRDYVTAVDSEPALQAALRRFRKEVQFRIIWRDLLRWADLEETIAATSDLADIAIQGALDWLYADACEAFGTPYGADPVTGEEAPQPMVVLGMGKLGVPWTSVSS